MRRWYRALVVGVGGMLLVPTGACSTDKPKGLAAAKAGALATIFEPEKDGAVNSVAVRGDGTLFIATSQNLRSLAREGRQETVSKDAVGSLATGKDAIYALGIRDGIVYEFGSNGKRQVALANAPETAGPTDPGLDEPYSLAWDPKTETLLAADQYKVDRIDPRSRHIETVTGSRVEEPAPRANGRSARDARYGRIDDIGVDPTDGALVILASDFYRIDPSSAVVTIVPADTPGIGRSAMAFDGRSGDLFFASEDLQGHGRLYRLARDGALAIIVKYVEDTVRSLAVDSTDGTLYIATREAVFACATPEPEKCQTPE